MRFLQIELQKATNSVEIAKQMDPDLNNWFINNREEMFFIRIRLLLRL
jgi:hypothetical protein